MAKLVQRLILAPERIPRCIARFVLRRCRFVPFRTRLDFDACGKPSYAYGTYYAALEAKQLGIARISVIEFGVAGGNGLIELENIACAVEKETGIAISVFGFDSGKGMPPAKDYRDMPYVWSEGGFRMDPRVLQKRLHKAELILGDVGKTIKGFIEERKPDPIGFISFDLDYYSSTCDALKLLAEQDRFFLPRVLCYFDDCIGDDWQLDSEYAGEALAIREFNDKSATRKIAPIAGLRYKRLSCEMWHELMYVLHIFNHPLYCQYINPKGDWQLPLSP